MAHLTNFPFEFFYEIFTEDASRPLLYHGAKKSKMTKNPNQGGGGSCLIYIRGANDAQSFIFSSFERLSIQKGMRRERELFACTLYVRIAVILNLPW